MIDFIGMLYSHPDIVMPLMCSKSDRDIALGSNLRQTAVEPVQEIIAKPSSSVYSEPTQQVTLSESHRLSLSAQEDGDEWALAKVSPLDLKNDLLQLPQSLDQVVKVWLLGSEQPLLKGNVHSTAKLLNRVNNLLLEVGTVDKNTASSKLEELASQIDDSLSRITRLKVEVPDTSQEFVWIDELFPIVGGIVASLSPLIVPIIRVDAPILLSYGPVIGGVLFLLYKLYQYIKIHYINKRLAEDKQKLSTIHNTIISALEGAKVYVNRQEFKAQGEKIAELQKGVQEEFKQLHSSLEGAKVYVNRQEFKAQGEKIAELQKGVKEEFKQLHSSVEKLAAAVSTIQVSTVAEKGKASAENVVVHEGSTATTDSEKYITKKQFEEYKAEMNKGFAAILEALENKA